jgi:hypothetical protein
VIVAIRTILSTLNKLIKAGVPAYVLLFGESLGDNLLLTVLAREVYNRTNKKVWIRCNHPDLFAYNPHISLAMPFNTLLSTYLMELFGIKTVVLKYSDYNPLSDQDTIPEKHIVLKMADQLNLNGPITIKPDLILTSAEIEKGRYFNKQIAINISNNSAKVPVKNKEWLNERYQDVVNKFNNEYNFIQLGSVSDHLLNDVTDLRGKTSIRESAAILKNAALLISYAGFTMHLARAVDCRAVIIYGGREMPEQTGYRCFSNLYSHVHCSPCWLLNKCEYNRMCLSTITSESAIEAVTKELSNTSEPLYIDVINNG